jgi:hypothetical protein
MRRTAVHYPQFLECCQYTLDDFWKDIFDNCSRGKFPKQCTYDKSANTLYIYNGNKRGDAYSLPTNGPGLFKALIEIFRGRLGIVSEKEHLATRNNITSIDNVVYDDWKQVKSKQVRETLLHKYAQKQKRKYKLNIKEARQFLSVVNLGFNFHYLTHADVSIKNNEIVDIAKVTFNQKKRLFFIDNDLEDIVLKPEKNTGINPFAKSVSKYFREVSKKKKGRER